MKGIRIHDRVREALDASRPVVALESTVISHGLPRPLNREVAGGLEERVREAGGVPATIAVLDGLIRVGLEGGELDRLATEDRVRKCSLRDLGIVLAGEGAGATTVAATACIAGQVGIRVFATGGIGGVHRGQPFDISADLDAIASNPVVVVCAGAKAILDLPLTLEALETRGVPVLGWRTDRFPAFYCRGSAYPVDHRCEAVAEVSSIACAHWRAGGGGILVAVPVPEADAVSDEEAEAAVEQALAEAVDASVHGKDVTPFLLARVSELTGGRSRRANVSLLNHNASVAAWIAAVLAGADT